MEKTIRLDKFLADMGKGTRSQIKDMIRKGRIEINGTAEKKPERKVRIQEDQISLDGQPVSYVTMEYYMLNKPKGVVSATEDGRYQTVIDLISGKNRKDLFPVGRLDLDTEGLLLITNDGILAHKLLAPKKHVDKLYFARCKGKIPESAIQAFADGLLLPDGFKCLPAKLKILTVSDTDSTVYLTIREGKFHQVKRMMEAAGCPVIELRRLSMGPLNLDPELAAGEYRSLTEEELELLQTL